MTQKSHSEKKVGEPPIILKECINSGSFHCFTDLTTISLFIAERRAKTSIEGSSEICFFFLILISEQDQMDLLSTLSLFTWNFFWNWGIQVSTRTCYPPSIIFSHLFSLCLSILLSLNLSRLLIPASINMMNGWLEDHLPLWFFSPLDKFRHFIK